MLDYPNIDPVAFNLGPIAVHWYGLMYLLAFTMAICVANLRVKIYSLNWSKQEISDLIFYAALGVIVGGKVGYILFYEILPNLNQLNTLNFWPTEISLKNGIRGMSFHGGLLGVASAIYFFSKKTKKNFLVIADFVAPLVPLGLAAGRIGNFINGELWGRVTNVSWGMVFPYAGNQPRHPSQLYEFLLEGIILFIIVWYYARKPRPTGSVAAVFLMGYAFSRIVVEFFREPDQDIGFIIFNLLTMGQLLSIIMFLIGLVIFTNSWKKYANLS